MKFETTQVIVFFLLTALIALATYLQTKGKRSDQDTNKEYFLAGGGLSWVFVAGSITLTDIGAGNLVGFNGSQKLLVALWEISGMIGLFILAFVFLPVYYKYNCTTTTELLEKRYGERSIRTVISLVFLSGNVFLNLPITLYGGSLFMKSLFGVDLSIITYATAFAVVGGAYAIFGGLRAVAVSDTYSGVLLFAMALAITFFSLNAINFDFSGIPAERLTLIGDHDSDIPWTTLMTGMVFIQMYYWSTNQVVTQRAMASPSLKEAQKGVLAASFLRLLILPAMVIPGIAAFKLYGDIGDLAYGRVAADLLPSWLSGAFAAAIAAAVLTSFNSALNSAAALYVCDIHENFFKRDVKVSKLSTVVSLIFVGIAIAMVPFYNNPDNSLVETIQKLFGLMSMPVLSTFIVGLLFRNVAAGAMITAVAFGVCLYGVFVFAWQPFNLHYIHLMAITLASSVLVSLLVNLFVFRKKAIWDAKAVFGNADA